MKKAVYLDPVEIELGLRRAIEKSKQNFIGRNFIPYTYTVVIDDNAFEEYGDLLNNMGRMLGESLDTWILDKGYEKDGPATVQFERGQTQGRTFLVQLSYRKVEEIVPADEDAVPGPDMGGGEERAAAAEGGEAGPAARLEQEGAGIAFPLEERSMLVGRGSDCAIKLTDDTVSERHARVRVEYGKVTLEDLASTNGTRVNLRRIRKTVLSEGDRVSLGDVNFTFRSARPSPGDRDKPASPVAERRWRRRQPILPRKEDT
ncbi:MAG TPA: FhaA domain-containing protein [Syntrophorhabdaceae bacterium]|jgi:hypothetical protein